MAAWEVFRFEGKTATPKLTIRKGGQLGLNSAAVTKFQLSSYKYVILMINKEERMIGIQPTNDEYRDGKRSLKIVQGGATIPAKTFVNYYGLDQVQENRMECDWDSERNMIVAEYKL